MTPQKNNYLRITLITIGIIVSGYSAGTLIHLFTNRYRNPNPEFWTKTAQIQFGSVMSHVISESSIEIENRGIKPLYIDIAGTSCGCTSAVLGTQILAPREKTFLKAEIDVSDDDGTFSKTVTLSTNDPLKPSIPITYTGTAVHAITLSPSLVNFFEVDRGDAIRPIQIKISLNNTLDPAVLDTASAHANEPYIGVDLKRAPKELLLEARLLPQMPIGALRGSISFYLQGVDLEIGIPVLARVFGRIDPEPEVVNFNDMTPGQQKQAEIKLQGLRESDSITSVEVSENIRDFLTVSFDTNAAAGIISAKLIAPPKPGRFEATIIARVQQPAPDPDITVFVPVLAVVRQNREFQ